MESLMCELIVGHTIQLRTVQTTRFVEADVKNLKNYLQKSSDPYKMLLLPRAAHLENGLKALKKQEGDKNQHKKNNFEHRHAAKTLTELPVGSNVFIFYRHQAPNDAPRSYMVRTEDGNFYQNRFFLQPLRKHSDQKANRIAICADDTETETIQKPTLPACSDPEPYQTLEPTIPQGILKAFREVVEFLNLCNVWTFKKGEIR
ncbi:hypothetical protein PR048_028778 [Dryococelus australis]|uniref:Uncharacterized protein n=1 Tax=Dryococelus australis TaxID=614101 RepID=A0ABQ9GBH6_9NEOP|nr:hypothetical protein PR048_028778 [Dryococelus australis]